MHGEAALVREVSILDTGATQIVNAIFDRRVRYEERSCQDNLTTMMSTNECCKEQNPNGSIKLVGLGVCNHQKGQTPEGENDELTC